LATRWIPPGFIYPSFLKMTNVCETRILAIHLFKLKLL